MRSILVRVFLVLTVVAVALAAPLAVMRRATASGWGGRSTHSRGQ